MAIVTRAGKKKYRSIVAPVLCVLVSVCSFKINFRTSGSEILWQNSRWERKPTNMSRLWLGNLAASFDRGTTPVLDASLQCCLKCSGANIVPVTSERRDVLSKIIQLFPMLVESFRYRRWPLSLSSLHRLQRTARLSGTKFMRSSFCSSTLVSR